MACLRTTGRNRTFTTAFVALRPVLETVAWSGWLDLHQRPRRPKRRVLAAGLHPGNEDRELVAVEGVEPRVRSRLTNGPPRLCRDDHRLTRGTALRWIRDELVLASNARDASAIYSPEATFAGVAVDGIEPSRRRE